jgi:hypothetical protein
MAYDPAALEILDILEEDRKRAVNASLREIERVRDKMDEIRAHPQNRSQATMTGSFLESIGIRRNPKAKPTLVELNLEEIDAREEKERRERKAMREKQGGEANKCGKSLLTKAKGKKRLRTRRER